mmetsp:Transcript_2106/g.4797  ORF Transcript_2106/g.4797 Transcript_2106/m.4797 type:complete len:368 (+) Transcript_2106:41-1144(+)
MGSEGAAELLLRMPAGPSRRAGRPDVSSWDFPLSRGEKVARVLLMFEAELEQREREVSAARKENDSLRNFASQVSQTAAVCRRCELQGHTPAAITPPTPPPGAFPRQAFTADPTTRRRRTTIFGRPGEAPVLSDPSTRRRRTTIFGRRAEDMRQALPELEMRHESVQLVCSVPAGSDSDGKPPSWSDGSPVRSPLCTPPLSPRAGSNLICGDGALKLDDGDTAASTRTFCSSQVTAIDEEPVDRAVTAVQWGGVDTVQWLRFAAEGDSDNAVAGHEPDGELRLHPGEHVMALRGLAGLDCAAVWLVLETSERSVSLGLSPSRRLAPSFCCQCEPGSEIFDIVSGLGGGISGAKQRLIGVSTEEPAKP